MSRNDLWFRVATGVFGVLVIAIVVAIGWELTRQSMLSIRKFGLDFWRTSTWDPVSGQFGALPFIWGTLYSSILALLLATPISLGIAVFIAELSPAGLRQPLVFLTELLAAIPSIVYGLWGIVVLVPAVRAVEASLPASLRALPLFSGPPLGVGMLAAALILAIMVIPFTSSVAREVLKSVPVAQREAAYALGATRFEAIRAALFYARTGIVGAVMLGFGRALGETIAVAMVLSTTSGFFYKFLEPGGNTIAANIALQFKNAFTNGRGALIASGLVLFIMTLIVNYLARWIARRGVITDDSGKTRGRKATAQETAPTPAASPVDAFTPHQISHAQTPADVQPEASPLAHTSPLRRATDWVARGGVGIAFLLAVLPLASILILVISNGLKRFDSTFINNSMRGVAESDPGGGAYHAIQGTLEQAGIATLIAVPIGVMVAVYLVEYGRGIVARAVTFIVDVMMGLPSIVAGLFILSLWILSFGFKSSGFAGSLALMILMLPLVIRSSEEMIKLVPHGLREASYALGVPKWRTIMRVVIPTALPGIVTGVMLGVARVMGETAPVLLVVGFTSSINPNPFNGAQGSLPAFIFNEATQPYQPAIDRAWAGALTLILIIMLLNLIARLVAWWKQPGRA